MFPDQSGDKREIDNWKIAYEKEEEEEEKPQPSISRNWSDTVGLYIRVALVLRAKSCGFLVGDNFTEHQYQIRSLWENDRER